jgi:hypothetical protein
MREPILLTLAILTQYRHFVTHTVLGLTDSILNKQQKQAYLLDIAVPNSA